MKREIKFRAWDIQDKRMITHEQEFIPLKVTSIGVFRLSPAHEDSLYSLINPERFILEQFTGLKDFYGVDIYEEDILEYNPLSTGVVKIESSGVCAVGFECFISNNSFQVCKVIGNIHENKDLLL